MTSDRRSIFVTGCFWANRRLCIFGDHPISRREETCVDYCALLLSKMVMIRFSVSSYCCLVMLVVICIQSMGVLSLQHYHLKINRHAIINRSQRLHICSNNNVIQNNIDIKLVKNIILSGSSTLVALSLLVSIPMQSALAVDSTDGSSISSVITSSSDSNKVNELTDIEQARVLRKLQL